MAHIIAQSEDGPRGEKGGGADTYANLVLLCPSCHTAVDKAPDAFPARLLQTWKEGREEEVERAGQDVVFQNINDLKAATAPLLAENNAIFEALGPQSQIADHDPGSDAIDLWTARRLDTILPNNRRLMNMIEANVMLLDRRDRAAFGAFKVHALSYEQQIYDRVEFYPLFPKYFAERFG